MSTCNLAQWAVDVEVEERRKSVDEDGDTSSASAIYGEWPVVGWAGFNLL